MAIPTTAKALSQPLDPADIDYYGLIVTQAGTDTDPFPILNAGETITSYTLALPAEAVAAGLIIRADAGREMTLVGNALTFWLSIDPSLASSSIFDGAGVTLPLELTVNTSGLRRKQKTSTITVKQQ